MRSRSWQLTVSDDLVRPTRQAIWRIASEIEKLDPESCSAWELCERALLAGYLSMYGVAGSHRSLAVEYLNTAAGRVPDNLPSDVFCGLSAIGWTIEHLTRLFAGENFGQVQPGGSEDPLTDIDGLILRRLKVGHWRGSYDLLRGIVGFGVYFLERLPRRTAMEGVSLILDCLEQQAEESSLGITWRTPAEQIPETWRHQYPAGYYNLGVAHGIPAVMQFLGELVFAGIEVATAGHLLEGSIVWMQAQQQGPDAPSRYSRWVIPGDQPTVSPLAWCYGDVGIAGVLRHVARRLGREDWLRFAKSLLDASLVRPLEQVTEVGLCHGAMGIAHVFNRAYQSEHDVRYKEAANRYYMHGLALMDAFEASDVTFVRRLHRNRVKFSFLQGEIGVALALLSAVSPIEPQWDRRLMLSGCPRLPG